MCVAVVLDVGIVRAELDKRYVMTSIYIDSVASFLETVQEYPSK